MKTTYGLDAFGRGGTIIRPDGAATAIQIIYTEIRVVDRSTTLGTGYDSSSGEVDSTRGSAVETYDVHGRLIEVKERDGSRTGYRYDASNRLKRVCQGAAGSLVEESEDPEAIEAVTCGQTRTFNWDGRGFLVSETHPEKGVSGNGTVSYPSYDARGPLRRRLDGPFDLTYEYDVQERLTKIRETSAPGTLPLKTFSYGTSTAASNRSRGKLETAVRYNEIAHPVNRRVAVTTSLTYAEQQGRLSRKVTSVASGPTGSQTLTPGESFRSTYTYTPLGDLASIGYPQCTQGACSSTPVARTVSYSYSNGYLSDVPGYASGISYHPNGLFNVITHTNGMTDTQVNDPDAMARPRSFTSAKTGVGTRWQTSTYTYDGSGNVTRIGDASFSYDALGRIKEGRVSVDPVTQTTGGRRTFNHAYDLYGNLTSLTANGTVRSTPTSSATNRLASPATYDAAGNLTSWNTSQYQYDPFNLVKRYITGTHDWRYVYDADDERFRMERPGTTSKTFTLRDPAGRVLRQIDSHLGWGSIRDYVYRGSSLLAAETPEGRRHFHLDHLGTPRLVTDGNGNQVAYYVYYPYGEQATPFSASDPERMKFTGHERDFANPNGAGDDIDYMHARHFNPLTGRFLSVDPVTGVRSRPQSWNRYSHVLGSPLSYKDPDGRFWGALFKVGKIILKGGDAVATIGGIYKDAQTVSNPQSSAVDKAVAVVSILSEVASPVSLKEVKAGARTFGFAADSRRGAAAGEDLVDLADARAAPSHSGWRCYWWWTPRGRRPREVRISGVLVR